MSSAQQNYPSSYLGLGITHSTMSLSQKLKQTHERTQRQLSKSSTLPTLHSNHSNSANSNNRNMSQEVYSMYLSPSKAQSVATRLSGLPESVNSSALFTEKVAVPTKPVTLCIRCSSTHAALCMICVEQDCQNALTFYRKTRAAGAATLFSKAFIEAGYTKLLKFVIFRLLKNGFETRRRQHMKKKTVVEKLFGTNLVCIPFSAWKRYTKENIMNRKNRTISELSERVKILEAQVHKLTSTVQENNFQIDFLKGELTKRDGVINDQKNEIGELKHLLKCDRNRVKSLAQMTSPLIRYAETVTKIIHQKLGETGRYISHAALPTTYNFSNVIQDDVFDEFTNHKLNHDGKVMNGKAVSKTSSSKSSVVAAEIALKWITMVSQSADDQLPPPGGRKLMHYLPAHQIPESLFDLRSGKNLARAVVSIVLDRQSIVRQQDVGHPLPAFTVKYSKSWPQKGIEIEDLEHMKTLQNKTMELISFTLDLATHVLDLPHHSPNDVFSGKIDVIFQIVVELMNAAVPKMNQKERNSIEQRINRFYELNSELEQLQSDKPDLTTLNHLDYFLQREFQKRREISEEEALIANLKSHSDDNAAGETVYFGGGCEIDHRLVSTMNDKQYEKMCTIVDETITSGQYEKVTDLSTKIISINEQLLDLASVISQGRDQRDMEIRMTTEVRQLLLAQYMGHNFVVSQTPIQFNIQGTTIQQIHQIDQPVEHQHSS